MVALKYPKDEDSKEPSSQKPAGTGVIFQKSGFYGTEKDKEIYRNHKQM